MRIVAIERDTTSCNQYRILGPMVQLKEQGLAEVITMPEDATMLTEASLQTVLAADIILVPRPSTEEWFEFIKVCRKYGKLIVSDYDDDPFNTSPFNPYYRFVGVKEVMYQWPDGTKEWMWQDGMKDKKGNPGFFNLEANIQRRDLFFLNFKKSDLVTCTTKILQETLKKMNPNTEVLPNLIDLDLYYKLDCHKKEVRICWQGGSSHYEDLWMVHKSIKRILAKYPNTKFIYFGDYQFRGMFSDCNKNQIELVDWVHNNAYHYKLACLNIDIGLCPIVDNVFNRNKSSIKWMEYSAVGAATIASNIPPYSVTLESEKTGLLVNDDDWFDAIERLVLDAQLRKKLADQAYDEVVQNHSASKFAYLWRDCYDRLLKGETVNA